MAHRNEGDSTDKRSAASAMGTANRDLVALGIAVAAILMFVGTGGSVLPRIARSFISGGLAPDPLLTNAVLLNIALIIFGWRRYKQLTSEVAERRKAEEQARYLAEIDPLTDCLNRRSIAAATDRLIAKSANRGEVVAFIMLDLDDFKHVNDVHGHAAGDALLRQCAARIREVLGHEALIARLGGDEFACVVSFDPHHPERIENLTEKLIEQVAAPISFQGIAFEATISAGVTRSDASTGTPDSEAMLHMADIALYHAKKNGRNRHSWFDPAMESELRFRSELESGIRQGIPRGEFVPFYEKQIDLRTGELVGFEMLARWNSPVLGNVKPEIFIPVAEEIGLIAELSESLIRQALRDARDWSQKLTISVNISPLQLRDPWFAQKLLKLLVETNFPPHRLEIEITESALHENIALVRSQITSLKNQGIRVSLDDFGTGYSSLSQLRNLPFDRIKIDRSFVTSLPQNEDSAAIVRSIVQLGEGLGLPITAEGIENENVLRELQNFGQFKGQGYLYGQPQSAQTTREDLAQLDLLLEFPQPRAAAAAPEAQGSDRRARRA